MTLSPLFRVLRRGVVSDMTKNLRIKAVAFDLSVILNPDGQKLDLSPSSSSFISHDDLDAGASRRKNPVTQEAPPSARLITSKAVDNTPAAQSKSSDSLLQPRVVVDYKQKYAEKLAMKTAKAAQKSSFAGNVINTATRWLLKEGMGDVLDYTHHRTVKLAALGGPERSTSTIHSLASQLNSTKFSHVRACFDDHELAAQTIRLSQNPEDRKAWLTKTMIEMEERLDVSRAQVLLISGDEMMLSLARDRGYYTCRYTGDTKRFGQITTDFRAEKALEVKDAIDSLIGIALRSSVSFIPYQ